jgi:hypothetical protein
MGEQACAVWNEWCKPQRCGVMCVDTGVSSEANQRETDFSVFFASRVLLSHVSR